MRMYMLISDDELELPVRFGYTARELAEKIGVRTNSINSAISKAKKYGYKSKYECVEMEQEDGIHKQGTD